MCRVIECSLRLLLCPFPALGINEKEKNLTKEQPTPVMMMLTM